MSVRPLVWMICGALAVSSVACGGEQEPEKKPAGAAKAGAAKTRASATAVAEPEKQAAAPVGPPIDFNDSTNLRDPFLSYAHEFAAEAKKRVRSQREVVLDQFGLDELKLSALMVGIRPARAMLVDPTKKGHIIHEGQFVGRAEVVQGGASGADYEINWRVDRIRESDIVLVREDPSNPDVPTATRVIPLRPDEMVAAATP